MGVADVVEEAAAQIDRETLAPEVEEQLRDTLERARAAMRAEAANPGVVYMEGTARPGTYNLPPARPRRAPLTPRRLSACANRQLPDGRCAQRGSAE